MLVLVCLSLIVPGNADAALAAPSGVVVNTGGYAVELAVEGSSSFRPVKIPRCDATYHIPPCPALYPIPAIPLTRLAYY